MESSNIWQSTLNEYDLKFYPILPSSFFIQMDVLVAFYILGILFTIAGFVVRLCRGVNHFWWLRIERTPAGLRIHQNTAVSFLLFKCLFCILVVISIFKQIRVYKYHESLTDIIIWRTAIWLPLLGGGIVEAIGMLSASPLLKSAENLITSQQATAKSPSIPYLLTNTFAILFPITSLISSLIPFIIANRNFNNLVFNYFDEIRPILENANLNFDGSIDLTILSTILPLQQSALKFQSNAAYWTMIGFSLLSAWAIFAFLLFLIGATSVYRILKFQKAVLLRTAAALRNLTSLQHEEGFSISRNNTSSTITHDEEKTVTSNHLKFNGTDAKIEEAKTMELKSKELERARILLICQGFVFGFCVVAYSIVCFAIALHPTRSIENSTYFMITQLGASYIYAIIGIPSIVLVTYSGFSHSGNFIGTPSSSNQPIGESNLTLFGKKRLSHRSRGINTIEGDEEEEDNDITELELRRLGIPITRPTPAVMKRNSTIPPAKYTGSNSSKTIRNSTCSTSSSGSSSNDKAVEITRSGNRLSIISLSYNNWKPSNWARMKEVEKEKVQEVGEEC